MKRHRPNFIGPVLIVGLIMAGSAFSLGNSSNGEQWEKQHKVASHDVIKVHTDHGVVTIEGRADSWDAAEHAEFVADSLADVQIVNNQVSMFPTSRD